MVRGLGSIWWARFLEEGHVSVGEEGKREGVRIKRLTGQGDGDVGGGFESVEEGLSK